MIARLYVTTFAALERLLSDLLIGTLGRLVFAGTLLMYFWTSAMTKVGDGVAGLVHLPAGAYAQILPAKMAALEYDPSRLDLLDQVIVHLGTYAEFVLPFLIVAGLFTRLAALGMIGFIAVMTYVDIAQHGVDAATIGTWFDRDPSSLIADQRSFWVFLLMVLVLKGPGPLSLDRLLGRNRGLLR